MGANTEDMFPLHGDTLQHVPSKTSCLGSDAARGYAQRSVCPEVWENVEVTRCIVAALFL